MYNRDDSRNRNSVLGLESPSFASPFVDHEDASLAESRIQDDFPFSTGESPFVSSRIDSGEYQEEKSSFLDDEAFSEECNDFEQEQFRAGQTIARDAALAVPALTGAALTAIGPPLIPTRSKAAIKWNAKQHPRQSGVAPDSILAALASYVDLAAVRTAITDFNVRNPRAPIALGSAPIDAEFVEAINQFQRKICASPAQPGYADAETLDCLGLWPRPGLHTEAQTNEWARTIIRTRAMQIDAAIQTMPADLVSGLSASNWWTSFVRPCYLGWSFVRPIHVYLARKLRQVELHLLAQPPYAGRTPVELAQALSIDEKHAGGRSEATSRSIHTFGLGLDIKYLGNPHVGDYRDKPNGAKRFSEVMNRAALVISRVNLGFEKFPLYLDSLGTDASKDTSQIYDALVQRDRDLRQYLARPEANADLDALRSGVFQGSQSRDPLRGFLNLHKDLVLALRDHAGLVWGAVDFGPNANGDIMHFDCRLDAIGRAVFCGLGGTFNTRHPSWNRTDSPCPEPVRPRSRRRTQVREMSEEELGNPVWDESEFDESEWDDEASTESVDDRSMRLAEERETEAVESEVPALRKHLARSDPPGQTIYVGIDLGYETHCVKWAKVKEKTRCVEAKTGKVVPETGIFIPENYVASGEPDIILYLHGHKYQRPGWDAPISTYWDGRKFPEFALREAINASQRNVILVAPTLGVSSQAQGLVKRHGLDRYLESVMEALKAYGPYSGQAPSIGNIIIAAHSGGGNYMRSLATSGNEFAGKIRECWGFDSLYGSGDVEPWRRWAKSAPQFRRLFSYFRGGDPKVNSLRLHRDTRDRSDPVANIVLVPSVESDHFKLILLYMRERLKDTAFLGGTSSGSTQVQKENAESGAYELHFEAAPEGEVNDSQSEASWVEEYQWSPMENALEEGPLEEGPLEEGQAGVATRLASVVLLQSDLTTPIGEDDIIGFDTSNEINLRASVNTNSSDAPSQVQIELLIRTPGKPSDKIVARSLEVPKKGVDPNDAGVTLYELTIPTDRLEKLLTKLDKVKEVATVRRIDGTSDLKLTAVLGSGWKLRGQAVQADRCGVGSGSLADERPDAFKLIQAGGVAILELTGSSGGAKVKRFIRNPADVFYYTGHGLGLGFSLAVNAVPPFNCLAIEGAGAVGAAGYCCWLKPSDLTPHWTSPMDLDVFIIAGCSVLAIDTSSGVATGDGMAWIKLLKVNKGPLVALLGYGDVDHDEEHAGEKGPNGHTAPLDKAAGNDIASDIGAWIKKHPDFSGIIPEWLKINMSYQNPFAIGFDKDGFCWRTRRKPTSGWTTVSKLVSKDRIRYVIEKTKVV